MMTSKEVLISFLILFSTVLFAQERHRLEVETIGGYAYNYFKSPDQIRVNDSLLGPDALISSSVFQDVLIDYDYRYKWKGNRLRLSLTPYARLFQEQFEDSYWSLDARVKYDREIGKRFTYLAEAHFKRMDREGLDGAQDVLVNPLGYSTYSGSTGLQFEPNRKHKTSLEAFYTFKDFDPYGTRDLQYNAYGVKLGSRQKFRPGRYEHVLGVSASYRKRNYTTFNASDVVSNGTRDWDYVRASLFYELPVTATFSLKPDLHYYARIDRLEDRSGFRQYGPSLGLKWDTDKTRVRGGIRYVIRNYSTIEARNDLGILDENLQYTYTDVSLDFEHQMGSKGMALTGTAYSRMRETNYTDLSARSFRGYTYYYAGVGFQWTF